MIDDFDISAAIEEGFQVLGTPRDKKPKGSALPTPQPMQKSPHADMRTYERRLVNWRMAIVYECAKGKNTFHGRARDISLGGVSIYCDNNIFFDGAVSLLLALPPLNAGQKERILEIHSKMVYNVVTKHGFRVGLQFLKFKSGEKKLLEERINFQSFV